MAGSSPVTSLTIVLGRLFWMMVGPLALMLTIYFIVSSGTGWRTFADLLYFIILGGMIFWQMVGVPRWQPTDIDRRAGKPR